MNLHTNKKLFRQSVEATAQQKKIPSIYVEKDYWVTLALYTIYHHPIAKETVFKGGTALSKCFGLIDRFSEDIDMVVKREMGESDNKLKSKIKQISNVVSGVMPEVNVSGITRKMGMNRKTAHTYAKEFSGEYGQVRDVIIIEATWLGYYEPYVQKPVSSLIYEMMLKTGQTSLAEEYGLLPFEVSVLDPKRTICEKIMSLVRFSWSEYPMDDLKKKIRHAYDLNRLLNDKALSTFFDSSDFEKLLLKVAQDDVKSFRNNNFWLQHHPNEAVIFSKTAEVWNELKETYTGEFSPLVFGDFPDEAKIYQTLERIKYRLLLITWEIKV